MNRLLIIDDDLDVARVIGRAASSIGFETQVANDAENFLTLAATWKPTVSVIDLRMPDIDGVQLLSSLAHMRTETSIVIASGMDARTIETVRRLGEARGLKVSGVLAKPFKLRDLAKVLEPFLQQSTPFKSP
jgi:CheY-like chemotaxis protein